MEMRREPAAARGDEIDDVRRAVHRLERADAERDVEGGRLEPLQQVEQRRRRRRVAAVRPEMDAGERDLLEAGRRGPGGIANDDVRRQAPAGTAGRRDDAVAASLVAAGLHPQRERRPAGDAGLERRAARPVADTEALGGGRNERSSFSSFLTTRTTFGSAASSSGRRVA